MCVLGKYKIGYETYIVPDYLERTTTLSPYVMGTRKWRISYKIVSGRALSHTIPGLHRDYAYAGKYGGGLKDRADLPYMEHPKWQAFLAIFKAICISKEGEAILPATIKGSYTKGK